MKIVKLVLLLIITLSTNQLVKQIKMSNTEDFQRDPYMDQELQGRKSNRLLVADPKASIHKDQTHKDIGKSMIYDGIAAIPLEFLKPMKQLEQSIREHRAESVSLISSEIKAAAISIYIANSVLVMKMRNSGYSERILLPYSEETKGLQIIGKDRELVETYRHQKEKIDKERDLLKVAENGNLFDINMDDIYEVDQNEIEKFKKDIKENNSHI